MALEAIRCSTAICERTPTRDWRFQPSIVCTAWKKLTLCPDVYPEQVMATASSTPASMLAWMREKSRRRARRLSSGRLSKSEMRLLRRIAPNRKPVSQRVLLAMTPGKSER